jgi:hypothetical protein
LRYQDIEFGTSYRIKRTFHRAEVVGHGKKGINGRYRIPVRYPDARPGSKLANVVKQVEAIDFDHKWTEEDQEKFDLHMRAQAETESLVSGLVAAGFPPYSFRKNGMNLMLTFDNETAQEVILVLLAHPQEAPATRGTKALQRRERPTGPGHRVSKELSSGE